MFSADLVLTSDELPSYLEWLLHGIKSGVLISGEYQVTVTSVSSGRQGNVQETQHVSGQSEATDMPGVCGGSAIGVRSPCATDSSITTVSEHSQTQANRAVRPLPLGYGSDARVFTGRVEGNGNCDRSGFTALQGCPELRAVRPCNGHADAVRKENRDRPDSKHQPVSAEATSIKFPAGGHGTFAGKSNVSRRGKLASEWWRGSGSTSGRASDADRSAQIARQDSKSGSDRHVRRGLYSVQAGQVGPRGQHTTVCHSTDKALQFACTCVRDSVKTVRRSRTKRVSYNKFVQATAECERLRALVDYVSDYAIIPVV